MLLLNVATQEFEYEKFLSHLLNVAFVQMSNGTHARGFDRKISHVSRTHTCVCNDDGRLSAATSVGGMVNSPGSFGKQNLVRRRDGRIVVRGMTGR